jgi:hypothetical protein
MILLDIAREGKRSTEKEGKNVPACFIKWSACAHRFRSIREENFPYAYAYFAKSPLWVLVNNNNPRSMGRGPHIIGERSARTKKVHRRSAHD